MKYFGTDGIRGKANIEINLNLVDKIGKGLSQILINRYQEKEVTVLIATDTRISRDFIKSSLIANLTSFGINIIDLGIFPTPAVSFLTESFENIKCGIMISASHNPFEDNGIKIFDNNGKKLINDSEEEIEKIIDNPKLLTVKPALNEKIGIIEESIQKYKDFYFNHIISSVDSLNGMKIALDCANGATTYSAKKIFSTLGAEVTVINDSHNGININDNCGSTHPNILSEFVKINNFDLGFAFDGDGDRCIAIDNNGNVLDGDDQLFFLAQSLKYSGELKNNSVVTTIMTSLAFDETLNKLGISVIRTNVGDKYVADEMFKNDYFIGGEQSGHIIYRKFANTGDGVLSALQVSKFLKNKNAFNEASKLKRYPQKLINVKVNNKESIMSNKK